MLKDIKSPSDIKKLTLDEANKLAAEIRVEILQTVSENGGHLAPNLGVVEATIALHRVFDFNKDKIIFDTGHQCYTHKLLTGRADQFKTLRKTGGISGFTAKNESNYDILYSGHSGTSLSAALGIAAANKLSGDPDRSAYTVALIGDGAFTNGMIYEALNNCSEKKLRLIILLNDNDMSISCNVGGLSKYLSSVRASGRYNYFKHRLQMILTRIPLIGRHMVSGAKKMKDLMKRVLIRENFFENFRIDYLGPVDGHDISKLETVLNVAKTKETCCLVHMKTKKGMGYQYALDNPELYHSVSPFDTDRGVRTEKNASFTSVFGEILCKQASFDVKICAVTAAMCGGSGLSDFRDRFPDRFFDVGIAEEHAVTFCGGLSLNGLIPVCTIYSTFAQRVYDQLLHDISIQKASIVLVLSHCGLVAGDGITHQGIFDCSFISSIPDANIFVPETYEEMREVFDYVFSHPQFNVIRFPTGAQTNYDRSLFQYDPDKSYSVLNVNADIVIITYGRVTEKVYGAYTLLSEKYSVSVIKLLRIHPLDHHAIFEACGCAKLIYILEEGIYDGGIAQKIASAYALYPKEGMKAEISIRAIRNEFIKHGDLESLYTLCGFQPEQIADEIERSMMKMDEKTKG